MSANIFAPIEIRELFVVASQFKLSQNPAANMELNINISLDEGAIEFNEEEGLSLAQQLTVSARLLGQEEADDERMVASVSVHIKSFCKAEQDAPGVSDYMHQSGLSIAYGHARSCIASMTSMSALGQLMIPALNPKVLLEEVRKAERN